MDFARTVFKCILDGRKSNRALVRYFYSPPRRIVLDQVGKQAPLSHYPELGSDQTVIDLMTIRVAMQCLAEITYLSAETDHGENPFLSHVRSEGSVEDFD
jgi:hypothetical protein